MPSDWLQSIGEDDGDDIARAFFDVTISSDRSARLAARTRVAKLCERDGIMLAPCMKVSEDWVGVRQLIVMCCAILVILAGFTLAAVGAIASGIVLSVLGLLTLVLSQTAGKDFFWFIRHRNRLDMELHFMSGCQARTVEALASAFGLQAASLRSHDTAETMAEFCDQPVVYWAEISYWYSDPRVLEDASDLRRVIKKSENMPRCRNVQEVIDVWCARPGGPT